MKKSRQGGHVYILKIHNFYKIGASSSPRRRAYHLNLDNPYPWQLYISPYSGDMYEQEKVLKEKYKHKKHRNEWYFLEEDFDDIIRQYQFKDFKDEN